MIHVTINSQYVLGSERLHHPTLHTCSPKIFLCGKCYLPVYVPVCRPHGVGVFQGEGRPNGRNICERSVFWIFVLPTSGFRRPGPRRFMFSRWRVSVIVPCGSHSRQPVVLWPVFGSGMKKSCSRATCRSGLSRRGTGSEIITMMLTRATFKTGVGLFMNHLLD